MVKLREGAALIPYQPPCSGSPCRLEICELRVTGIEVVPTAPCTPRMSVVVERFLGGVRRECLDHVIILGEDHLRCVLDEYARSHFNRQRPLQGLQQLTPMGKAQHCSNLAGNVVAFPVLNGLHHRNQRVA